MMANTLDKHSEKRAHLKALRPLEPSEPATHVKKSHLSSDTGREFVTREEIAQLFARDLGYRKA